MAALATSEDVLSDTAKKPFRTRRTHQKVKSGCITCKIRRKKCDETKPSCLRCTSTGRKCDGYASAAPHDSLMAQSPENRKSEPLEREAIGRYGQIGLSTGNVASRGAIQTWQTLRRQPSSITFTSEIEVLCFDYFRCRTGPQLGSYHSSSLYRSFVMKAAISHPLMMKAAAAVGAAHRRYDLGISKEAFKYCEISARLYAEARAALVDFEKSKKNDAYTNDVVFIAAILHGLFEVFQNNHDKATEHFTRGVTAMWNRPTSILSSDSQWRPATVHSNLFHCLYRRLGVCTQSIIGRQPRILADFRTEPLPAIPAVFSPPGEGLDLMFTEASYILQTPASIWKDKSARRKLQTLHVSRLLQWSAAYADTADTAKLQDPWYRQVLTLHRRFRSVTYQLLYLTCFAMNDPGRKAGRKSVTRNTSSSVPNDVSPVLDNGRIIKERKVAAATGTGRDNDNNHASNPIDLICSAKEDDRPEASKSQLAIDSPELWDLINQSQDILGNMSYVTMEIDSLLEEALDPHHEWYDCSLNFDTGFGPPRSNIPSPEGSSKTRHLVRTLLDPESRATVFSQSQSRYESYHGQQEPEQEQEQQKQQKQQQQTAESRNISSFATTSSLKEVGDSTSHNSNTNNKNHVYTQQPTKEAATRAYGIAEQLCSIEEHAVLAAARNTLMVPRGLKPQWLDISYYLDERRVRVCYCTEDDGSRGVIGAPGSLIWTQEWITY